jgi:hypothetical protein
VHLFFGRGGNSQEDDSCPGRNVNTSSGTSQCRMLGGRNADSEQTVFAQAGGQSLTPWPFAFPASVHAKV